MENNYSKAYKEIIEILKYIPQESVQKIPKSMLRTFESKMDHNYNFNIDINKSFEEQILLNETKAILANIFRDYWATPYQKSRIEEKEKHDRIRLEEEKRQQYNPNNIFKKENIILGEKNDEKDKSNNLPIEIKKESFFEKILHYFKNKFNI